MKTVKMSTTYGDITIELDEEKAPISVANFLTYVAEGFYNDTIFHRVIDRFMIQGGGFFSNMAQKPATHAPITNEARNGLPNDKYTIAMARTSSPNSASSQFFINVAKNDFLNHPGQDGWGYAVFGKVIDGTAVVDRITAVPKKRHGNHADVPVDPVLINTVTLVE